MMRLLAAAVDRCSRGGLGAVARPTGLAGGAPSAASAQMMPT